MDDLPPLNDSDLLWEVIKPVLDQYNPTDTCLGTLFSKIVCQIFVGHGINRDEFLDQMSRCYDAHYQSAAKKDEIQ